MQELKEVFMNFHKDEDGDVVQTGIVIGIFATLAVGAYVFLQPKIKAMFDKGGDALDEAESLEY